MKSFLFVPALRALIAVAALLITPLLAHAQPTRVQTAQAGGDGGQGLSVQAAFGSNVAAGNYGICGVRNGGDHLIGITDSIGTAYTQVSKLANGGATLWLYYGKFGAAGANTVTTSWASTSSVWLSCLEVSGLAAASVLDTFDAQAVGGGTDLTTDAITTTQSDEYVVLFVSQEGLGTYSAGADFTLVDGTIPTNPSNFGGVQDRVTSSFLSSYTPHITSTTTSVGVAIVAAFRGIGGAPTTRGPIRLRRPR